MSNLNLTLILSIFNSAASLEISLKKNLELGVFERIIVVDGFSQDNTLVLIEEYQREFPGRINLFQTPKQGLANARNFGTSNAQTGYVMHAGPDNIFSKETVTEMLENLQQFDLVSCQTRLFEVKNYLNKAHNFYKKRYRPGVQSVVGTPYMAKLQLFREFPFDETMLNSDDTELCHRLWQNKKRVYRSAALCYETGFNNFSNIVERWTRWGRGDSLFYNLMRKKWTFRRKIKSWLHPIQSEIIEPYNGLSLPEFFYTLPFLLMVLSLRYTGWCRFVLFGK